MAILEMQWLVHGTHTTSALGCWTLVKAFSLPLLTLKTQGRLVSLDLKSSGR